MQTFPYEQDLYHCNSCKQTFNIGIIFAGFEVVLDGLSFERKFFICIKCLESGLKQLKEDIKENKSV
jgi:hypothetical protein